MKGEIIVYDIDDNYAYERMKIGDGETNVNALPFISETFKPDWDAAEGEPGHIANRTHWSKTDIAAEVLPETNISISNEESGEMYLTTPFSNDVVAGNNYLVKWNEVEYSCIAQEVTTDVTTLTVLGNVGAAEGTGNTGEPFVIMIPPRDLAAEMGGIYAVCMALDGVTAASIQINEIVETIQTLDPKYLPKDDNILRIETELVTPGVILPEVSPEWTKSDSDNMYLSEDLKTLWNDNLSSIKENYRYTIVADGQEFKAVCVRRLSNMDSPGYRILNPLGFGVETSEVIKMGTVPTITMVELSNNDFYTVHIIAPKPYSTISVINEEKVTKVIPSGYLSRTLPTNLENGLGEGSIRSQTSSASGGQGNDSFAFGDPSNSGGEHSAAFFGSANGDDSFAVLGNALANSSVTIGSNSTANGNYSMIFGHDSYAFGDRAIALGSNNISEGNYSVSIGNQAVAHGERSIALGRNNTEYSIKLEGDAGATTYNLLSSDRQVTIGDCIMHDDRYASDNSFEGISIVTNVDVENSTITVDKTLDAQSAISSESYGHTAIHSVAYGNNSYINGDGLVALADNSYVIGTYNKPDFDDKYALIVGNGTVEEHSNSHTLSKEGDAWFAGEVYVNGTSQDDATAEKLVKTSELSGLATETYVNEQISGLVNTAPETLDTLNELAAALGDDPNFATTVATQIGEKVDKTTTINNKALSDNITLSASDVNADPAGTAAALINALNIKNGSNTGSLMGLMAVADNPSYTIGYGAISLGAGTQASGTNAFAIGGGANASGSYSVATGGGTTASGTNSFAGGAGATASGQTSFAFGNGVIASGDNSFATGGGTNASSLCAVAVGTAAKATGASSFAEGNNTIAASQNQHAQGKFNIEDNTEKYAHIVGNGDSDARSNAYTLDWDGNAWFQGNVYVGNTNQDDGNKLATESYANSLITLLNIENGSSEGSLRGKYAATENTDYTIGTYSFASGYNTKASGNWGSHAEGYASIASGTYGSHAEGDSTVAKGIRSHAEGYGTIAAANNQHAEGRFNVEDTDQRYLHIVGNGNSDIGRSNAYTLDYNGTGWYQTSVCVGGTNQDTAPASLAANGLILTDEATGTKYRVFISNAKLNMEVVE